MVDTRAIMRKHEDRREDPSVVTRAKSIVVPASNAFLTTGKRALENLLRIAEECDRVMTPDYILKCDSMLWHESFDVNGLHDIAHDVLVRTKQIIDYSFLTHEAPVYRFALEPYYADVSGLYALVNGDSHPFIAQARHLGDDLSTLDNDKILSAWLELGYNPTRSLLHAYRWLRIEKQLLQELASGKTSISFRGSEGRDTLHKYGGRYFLPAEHMGEDIDDRELVGVAMLYGVVYFNAETRKPIGYHILHDDDIFSAAALPEHELVSLSD